MDARQIITQRSVILQAMNACKGVCSFLQAFFLTAGVIVLEEKQRMIQEYVPGKQVTLAHLIANPQKSIYQSLGLEDEAHDAIGILTITPGEAVIIAADVATKAAEVEIGFLDRFGGALVIMGDVASVESAVNNVLHVFETVLRFATTEITHS